jgi:hypothetical protein
LASSGLRGRAAGIPAAPRSRGDNLPRLVRVHLAVVAAAPKKLLMRPALRDAAVLDHQDQVRVPHRGDPVGDDEGGAAAGEFAKLFLDLALRLHVHIGRGVVEDHDGRVLQQQARQREPLLLSAGEAHAALAHDRVIALGKLADEAVRVGQACGLDHPLHAGGGLPVGDVAFNGVGEEEHVLHGDAHLGPEALQVPAARGDPVDQHFPLCGVVEATEEAGDGRLARPRGAHDPHDAAGPHVEAHVREDGLVAIAE